jgi:hypothetical protein
MEIANWDKWQTFRKDRGTPPWIKVYRNLLSNEQWVELTDSEKGQLVSIWILAADKNGQIPDSPKMIQRMAMLDSLPNLSKFIELGFLTPACQPLDNHEIKPCPQVDAPEKSREETDKSREEETLVGKPDDSDFETLWILYGKKGNRKTSLQKFNKLNKANLALLKNHLPKYVQSTPDLQYRKGLQSYIEKECWNDEITTNGNYYETAKNNHARPESNLARFSRKIQADIAAEDPFE